MKYVQINQTYSKYSFLITLRVRHCYSVSGVMVGDCYWGSVVRVKLGYSVSGVRIGDCYSVSEVRVTLSEELVLS